MKILYKIYNNAQINPEHIAINLNNKISYGVIWQLASNLAFFLKEQKIKISQEKEEKRLRSPVYPV